MVNQDQHIKSYFPELDDVKIEKLAQLNDLYRFWNEKINVISRKDIDHLFVHHVLHSLSFLKFGTFTDKASIIDIGTGGGFPGIPLAIVFPDCEFSLVDGRSKKVHVVAEVVRELGLSNVEAIQSQAQDLSMRFDFALGRAVSDFKSFAKMASKILHPQGMIYYWTGGEEEDYQRFKSLKLFRLSDSFPYPYFQQKFILSKPKN